MRVARSSHFVSNVYGTDQMVFVFCIRTVCLIYFRLLEQIVTLATLLWEGSFDIVCEPSYEQLY